MPTTFRSRSEPHTHLWLGAATALLLLRGCGTTRIETLLDDPSRYDGQTVRIQGEVQDAVGILGFGAYAVSDGTGILPVVSERGGAPRVGAKVGVEGRFRAAFTIGTQSVAVLQEERRYTP